jgi:ABC-type multidrug transport system ATPase subunit
MGRSSETQVRLAPSLPLEVCGLTKTFRPGRMRAVALRRTGDRRPHPAVDDVSFVVRPGEVYGLIGANGSGKSTLIRVLSTLLLPDRGQVRVFGRDALYDPRSVRPLLNRVSADPSFFRAMSAMENLLFFGRAYGLTGPDARRRSAAILRRLDLGERHATQPMLHLSRGQQQKVAVARAFLSNPRLMLLDEPTTGLDPRSKRDVQEFVTEVRRQDGVAILLTTTTWMRPNCCAIASASSRAGAWWRRARPWNCAGRLRPAGRSTTSTWRRCS